MARGFGSMLPRKIFENLELLFRASRSINLLIVHNQKFGRVLGPRNFCLIHQGDVT